MPNERGNRPPLFRKMNYILMGVGALLLIIGYICLSGGKVPDDVFDGEIFNTRRLVVAPILMFLGLVTEIVAIMWHPKTPQTDNE
ncbi:MAG: DUF3098 domain-containing protein [Bacteroidales bacterium]|nr:DUF3098 domain-containing protein [Bacteroidales bacterium]